MQRHLIVVLVALAAVTLVPAVGVAQQGSVDLDTVRAGRFDNGKMWTFEYPPAKYFSETYGFDADERWFERARLAALRISGCSAALVSPHGLIVTNHHCARSAVAAVSRPGETLLDSGFRAASLEEERPVPRFYADQLIGIEDVSDEVFTALDRATDEAGRETARREALDGIEARARQRYAGQGDSIAVQIVPLYNGGRYSAYVFRRYTDVRLVVAAELQLGFFGGDPDNFTYPRYDLDFAFLRAYGKDGRPITSDHYFTWSRDGVKEGDAVFVIGSPGPTNRLSTVAQLEFNRDVLVPAAAAYLTGRLDVMRAYQRAEPEEAERFDIRNRMFGLSNSLKVQNGRLATLRDPVNMAKRRDAERQLRDSIAARTELQRRFGDLFDRIAVLQRSKAAMAKPFGAFYGFPSPAASAALLRRTMIAYAYLQTTGDSAAMLRAQLLRVGDLPPVLEQGLLAVMFADFERYLGPADPLTRTALGGRRPAAAAAALLAASALADSGRTEAAVAGNTLKDDPAMPLAAEFVTRFLAYQQQFGRLLQQERELAGELGRARFEVYGPSVPPDASSSPRITDGVVQRYEYNGTMAPPFTTFFGMYDRYASHGPGTEWDLPARWLPPPAGLDLSTPLNFISTADTYGGNSGSPAVTPQLELVGLNFDRNIEGLSRDFIYLPERGRNIMVDVRAIRAALDHVYDADRIVAEIMTGRLFATEAEADAAGR